MTRRLAVLLAVMVGACGLTLAVGTTRAASVTARLWAVGDMARCPNGAPASRAAADVVATDPRPLLALGDLAYPNGSASDFTNCYDPVWGAFRTQTRPAPGNHEYRTSGAAGYFGYFAPIDGWYAWELNGWQILALNSNCTNVGGCGVGSPEYTWLEAQLRDNPRACQLAYWHHPRWSQGNAGNTAEVGPLYTLLAQYGVELLLAGHDHLYQRYAPLDAAGMPDANGVVEIVAGTGGAEYNSGSRSNAPAPVVRGDNTFGALSVELADASWQTQFLPEAGRTFTDSASGACHGPAGQTPPTTTTTSATTTTVPTGTTTTTTTTPPGPDTQEPNSTVIAPLPGAGVTSPVTFTGQATDDVGVARVRVAVRDDVSRLWLQANGSFGSAYTQFDAALASTGARATGWSLARTLPLGSYHLSVKAVDTGGRSEASTPWVAFQVTGSSPTTTTTSTTTSTTTTSVPPTSSTTTAPSNDDVDDRWAFWGYLYSDGRRQSNGTYRWDQAPFRFTASSDRFQRGAALNGIGLRQDAAGAWYTTAAVATIPDPRPAGSAAVAAYLAAAIEDEGICGGMVFDNFSLTMVLYVADLYTAAGVPTTLRSYSGGFNELWVASAYWPVINTWPFATTSRTPGAPGCTVTSK